MAGLSLIVINYLWVQVAIILFIAPFFWFYKIRSMANKEDNFSDTIENFFESRQANYLVFFWAFGEALVWFIIPEFLLLLLIFMRVKKKKELLIYDIYGTIAGTVVALAAHLPNSLLLKLPYIQQNMLLQVHHWYDRYGIFGLFFQPFSGVPYKVFANMAGDLKLFMPLFLFVAIIVRISRYIIFYAVFKSIYPALHNFVNRHYIKLFFVSTFIFSALLLRVYMNYGPSYHIH